MEDYIMTMIKRTSIFMVLAQVLVHFRPSPDYERYFKFLTGMMAALMLFLPVRELFCRGSMEAYQKEMLSYLEELEQAAASEKMQIEELEVETPESVCLSANEEEIKNRLNKTLSKDGYVVSSMDLSEIQEGRVRLCVGKGEKENGKIVISRVRIREGGEAEANEEEKQERVYLQEKIAECLEIGTECVEVELIG